MLQKYIMFLNNHPVAIDFCDIQNSPNHTIKLTHFLLLQGKERHENAFPAFPGYVLRGGGPPDPHSV